MLNFYLKGSALIMDYNPSAVKHNNSVRKRINVLIIAVIYSLYVFIAYMLLNVFITYLFKVIVMLPSIVTNKPATNMDFKFCYLLNSGHMPVFIVLTIAVLMMSTFGRKLILSSSQKIYSLLPFEVTKSTIDGTSDWLPQKEYSRVFYKVSKEDSKPLKCGMVLATDDKNYYLEEDNVHTFVIGTTASGKTQTLVLPSIRTIIICKIPESFLTVDYKGEILENTYYSLKENGYNYFVLNLRDPSRSSC